VVFIAYLFPYLRFALAHCFSQFDKNGCNNYKLKLTTILITSNKVTN